MLHRPDDYAPVSNLFLFGRKQDFAFEQPVGGSPSNATMSASGAGITPMKGEPPGAATFDKGVGLSHTTGQVTHHIAADIDAERDRLAAALQQAGAVQKVQWIDDFHTECQGRRGLAPINRRCGAPRGARRDPP